MNDAPFYFSLNLKMEKRAPHPAPLPIGSADAERESPFPLPDKTMAVCCSVAHKLQNLFNGCSLSRGERVRVRGNAVKRFQAIRDRQIACANNA
jgi:hypothetical protein